MCKNNRLYFLKNWAYLFFLSCNIGSNRSHRKEKKRRKIILTTLSTRVLTWRNFSQFLNHAFVTIWFMYRWHEKGSCISPTNDDSLSRDFRNMSHSWVQHFRSFLQFFCVILSEISKKGGENVFKFDENFKKIAEIVWREDKLTNLISESYSWRSLIRRSIIR